MGCDIEEDKDVCISCKSKNISFDSKEGYNVCLDYDVINNIILDKNPVFNKDNEY